MGRQKIKLPAEYSTPRFRRRLLTRAVQYRDREGATDRSSRKGVQLALCLILLGLMSPMGVHAQRSGNLQNKPNIMLILADDLGWGDLGSYGQTKIKTPSI